MGERERPRRVFLSHTSDLREFPRDRSFVAAAENAVKRAGFLVTDMAYFPARNTKPADHSLQEVAKADVYAGIIGFRYGSRVRDRQDVSYTELEFERATELRMPRLVFLLDENGVIPIPAHCIRDLDYGRRQEEFRKRLEDEHLTLRRVSTPQELETELFSALIALPSPAAVVDAPRPRREPLWMVPQLPGRMVERRELTNRVIELLDGPVSPVTAGLWGAAGFGKTRLAALVCQKVRDRYPGGVLWVTLGDPATIKEADLVARLNDLAQALSGHQQSYVGVQVASAHLGQLIGEERRLLVVDDIRSADQLAPFLQGECARLLTTRDRTLLPDDADPVRVGAMTDAEAMELLVQRLDVQTGPELEELRRRTGGWPHLVHLANRAIRIGIEHRATVPVSAAQVAAALAAGGPAVLDPDLGSADPARTQAVRAALDASVTLLDAGGVDGLERYMRLAVFPENVDIPLVTLQRYWDAGAVEVARVCRDLADRELVEERGPAAVRLHTVLPLSADQLTGYHRALLDAHRAGLPGGGPGMPTAWWAMGDDEPYLWPHLTYHLREAAGDGGAPATELDALLRDQRWMAAQVRRLAGQNGHALTGHASRVHAVAISPDGAWLASGDADGTILLWNSADGTPRASMSQQFGVTSVAIGPDGTWLATAGMDGAVRLWSAPAGHLQGTLHGHKGAVNAVAMSRDGSLLATAGDDRTVRLWRASGELISTLAGHSGQVRSVAISPDGTWVASGGDDWITLWNVSDSAVLDTVSRRSGAVRAVVIAPDGTWFASIFRGTNVRIWGVADRSTRFTLAGHLGAVNALAVSPDGSCLASAARDGTVRLWGAADGTTRATLNGHSGAVNAVAISPDGSWLASGGDDTTVRLWRFPG